MWLKEGDNNTRFFHKMVNAHSRRNWLSKVKVNSCWHTEENEIKASVVGAFHDLFAEEREWRPSTDGLSFEGFDSSEVEKLELPFSEEEVFVALFDLGKDKALGPDGYIMAFWLFCWDVVKVEVLGFFRDFYEEDKFVKSLNAIFLTFVPRKLSCASGAGGMPMKERPFGSKPSVKSMEKMMGGSHKVSERIGVGLWKAIRKECDNLSSKLAFQVGNGQRVRF